MFGHLDCRLGCQVEWRYTEEGDRVRVSKRTGRIIPIPKAAYETYDYKTPTSYKGKLKDLFRKNKYQWLWMHGSTSIVPKFDCSKWASEVVKKTPKRLLPYCLWFKNYELECVQQVQQYMLTICVK